jgi:succinate dehydrogenase / fumarate reductase, cytochrome b subunit
MNKKIFRNFDLFTIRYPFTAIISILHRLSGVFVFLLVPFLLWLLEASSGSREGFDYIQSILANPIQKFILWLVWTALWYHLLAGIRHLLMDIGFGESLKMARVSGGITIIITIILAILTGIWLW